MQIAIKIICSTIIFIPYFDDDHLCALPVVYSFIFLLQLHLTLFSISPTICPFTDCINSTGALLQFSCEQYYSGTNNIVSDTKDMTTYNRPAIVCSWVVHAESSTQDIIHYFVFGVRRQINLIIKNAQLFF